MRVLLAGLFVFIAMIMTVEWLGSQDPGNDWPWWPNILILAVMFGSIILSLFIFNRGGERPSFKAAKEIINNLGKKGEEPVQIYSDEILGELLWNEDCESWVGTYDGLKFDISYDYEKTPGYDVLEHARKYITDKNWLAKTLEEAKQHALNAYPASFREEINSLTFKKLCFFDHERLHIQFFEDDNEPWWFAELYDGNLKHVGFDT
jgi:hypothetical protein